VCVCVCECVCVWASETISHARRGQETKSTRELSRLWSLRGREKGPERYSTCMLSVLCSVSSKMTEIQSQNVQRWKDGCGVGGRSSWARWCAMARLCGGMLRVGPSHTVHFGSDDRCSFISCSHNTCVGAPPPPPTHMLPTHSPSLPLWTHTRTHTHTHMTHTRPSRPHRNGDG
jgi:hypothetical protein